MLSVSVFLATAILTTKSVDCAAVVHKPAADVEYHEGQDAKGYAVTPADVAPPSLTKEDFRRIPVPLNIPLENYPAQNPASEPVEQPPSNPDTSESWVQPGLVTVDTQTGKVEMNGKTLTPPEPAELNPDCWK